jgi:hypothetical protein
MVSETPSRVVIEDVRSGQRTSASGLPELATKIAGWLEAPPPHRDPDPKEEGD